jgi:hypothetical protein
VRLAALAAAACLPLALLASLAALQDWAPDSPLDAPELQGHARPAPEPVTPERDRTIAMERAAALAPPITAASTAPFDGADSLDVESGRSAAVIGQLDPSLRLSFVGGPNSGRFALPDATGRFAIDALFPGRSDLSVSGATDTTSYSVYLRAGTTTQWSLDSAIPTPSTVVRTAGDQTLALSVLAPAPHPATVQVLGSRHCPDGRLFQIQPGQRLEITDLPRGRVDLLVSHPRARSERKKLYLDGEQSDVTLELIPVGELNGLVLRNGLPQVGVTVRLEAQRPLAYAYELYGLGPRESARIALSLPCSARQEQVTDSLGRFVFGDFDRCSTRRLYVVTETGRAVTAPQVVLTGEEQVVEMGGMP